MAWSPCYIFLDSLVNESEMWAGLKQAAHEAADAASELAAAQAHLKDVIDAACTALQMVYADDGSGRGPVTGQKYDQLRELVQERLHAWCCIRYEAREV